MTRTPLSRSKGQRSRSSGPFGWLYWQANMDKELVTDPYACMMYIVSPLAGLGGDILWRPPAYSLFINGLYCPYRHCNARAPRTRRPKMCCLKIYIDILAMCCRVTSPSFLGRLPKVDLIILEGENVRPYVRTSVRPQKVSAI